MVTEKGILCNFWQLNMPPVNVTVDWKMASRLSLGSVSNMEL